jgi:hypothetical protein
VRPTVKRTEFRGLRVAKVRGTMAEGEAAMPQDQMGATWTT